MNPQLFMFLCGWCAGVPFGIIISIVFITLFRMVDAAQATSDHPKWIDKLGPGGTWYGKKTTDDFDKD